MKGVRPTFGNDVDHSAAGAANFRRVIGPIDLKLIHSLLAQCGSKPAARSIGFAAVYHEGIASPIVSMKGNTAVGRLNNPIVGRVGQTLRIRHAWREVRDGQEI